MLLYRIYRSHNLKPGHSECAIWHQPTAFRAHKEYPAILGTTWEQLELEDIELNFSWKKIPCRNETFGPWAHPHYSPIVQWKLFQCYEICYDMVVQVQVEVWPHVRVFKSFGLSMKPTPMPWPTTATNKILPPIGKISRASDRRSGRHRIHENPSSCVSLFIVM